MTDSEALALVRVRRLCRSGLARAARRAAGLSLAEVARSVGVAHPTVSRWELGRRRPHGDAGVRYGALIEALLERSDAR